MASKMIEEAMHAFIFWFLDVFAQLEIFKRKDKEEKKRIQHQHKPVDDEYDSWISSS
jgi:hypothetical protein